MTQLPSLFYFFFGTSKQLSYGPDALSSLLTGITISKPENIGTSPEDIASMLSFIAGVILLLLGLFRVGFLDNILSRPLLAGFINAVATTILIEQLQPLFGLPPDGHGWRKIIHWWNTLGQMNWLTLGIGFVTVWIILVIKFLKKKVKFLRFLPETLLVVTIGIIVSKFAKFEGKTAILGDIPQGIQVPRVPNFKINNMTGLITDGLLLGIVGFVEHIAIGKIYAARHKYLVSPNRELVAVGVGNISGSFFHAYPTFGSLSRSSIADGLGATSLVFTLVTFVIITLTFFVGKHLFYHLPKAVMTGIIISAGIGLFEAHDFIFMFKIRAWKELLQSLLTLFLTIFLGVELGLIISLGVSIFFIIKHTTYPLITLLGRIPGTTQYKDVTHYDVETLPGIMIVRIGDPLYFANIGQIKTLFGRIERLGDPKAHPAEDEKDMSLRALIIHASNIPSMDASSIQIIAEMVQDYEKRDVIVCWVKLKEHLKKPFMRAGLITDVGGDRIFKSTQEAVDYVMGFTSSGDDDSQEGVRLRTRTYESENAETRDLAEQSEDASDIEDQQD